MIEKLVVSSKNHVYGLDDFPTQAVEDQIREDIEEVLSLNEPEVLKRRLAYVKIGQEADYINKWLETREGLVLAGIRHMGGNLDEPFVFMWPSFKIRDLKGVVGDIMPSFEIFKPKYVSFWVRPEHNDYDVDIVQQRFIGIISQMKTDNLELSKPETYYAWYENEYKKFHELMPEYVDRICCNDQPLMDQCLKENLLYVLKKDNQTIGLIAGENIQFLGEKSVYLNEILIANDFKGQGYGDRLLGSFLHLLKQTYFTCYIDRDNIPSTKVALKSGQKIFSQECFYRL